MSDPKDEIEAEEERLAFRYGVQVANEEIFKGLLISVLAHAESEQARKMLLEKMKQTATSGVMRRLTAAGCHPVGIEHRSASDIIDSVFDDVVT